ncbi:hypothetical protein F4777DRAFT_535915 [Nemania sp. FL0916]|nr:hypothetical protein F4777DRAFT_535915 [Nemania sp. FL0916]
MAPSSRARRPRGMTLTATPPTKASNNAPPLSGRSNRGRGCEPEPTEPNNTGPRSNKSKSHDVERREVARPPYSPPPKPYDPETYGAWGRRHHGEKWVENRNALRREGKAYVVVVGLEMLIVQTYDPDTYDPDRPLQGTPEPEPYDPETYAAWGLKRFGADWYHQRKAMMEERNIYMEYDPVYNERQRALRILEHRVENRPFKPRDGRSDESWKRLWARLSKDLPAAEKNSIPPESPRDDDTDLSGYDTYAPTPESREPSPLPDDPWEYFEFNRRRMEWTEEEHQFERIFMKEALIDGTRCKHENEKGNRAREAELEEIRKIRYYPGTRIESAAYSIRMRRFNLRAEGRTQEQIEAEEEAADERWLELIAQIEELDPVPSNADRPEDLEEIEARHREFGAFDEWATGRKEQNELARADHPDERPASTEQDTESRRKPQSRVSRSRAAKGTSHRTRSGRIVKNTSPTQDRGRTRLRRLAPTDIELSPPNQEPVPAQPSTAMEPEDSSRQAAIRRRRGQRKTYVKQRASRRLAGQPPEFGGLRKRGETPLRNAPSPQPSHPRRRGRPSRRGGRSSIR